MLFVWAEKTFTCHLHESRERDSAQGLSTAADPKGSTAPNRLSDGEKVKELKAAAGQTDVHLITAAQEHTHSTHSRRYLKKRVCRMSKYSEEN